VVTNEVRWLEDQPVASPGAPGSPHQIGAPMAIPVDNHTGQQPVMAVTYTGGEHAPNPDPAWQRTTDPTTGKVYEYNSTTQESRWL